VQTHIHKTEATGNDAHQNVLSTWNEVKTLHKQQNSHIQINTQSNLDPWNTTVGYGFKFKHRNPRTLPIKVLHMIVDAPWYMPNMVLCRALQTSTVKEEMSLKFSIQCMPHTPK
jgi:hypothetical protein